MNIRQRVALLVGVVLFCSLGLYAPWEQRVNNLSVRRLGYHWVFSGPRECDAFDRAAGVPNCQVPGAQVDVQRLIIQWVSVGVVFAGLVLVLGRTASYSEEL